MGGWHLYIDQDLALLAPQRTTEKEEHFLGAPFSFALLEEGVFYYSFLVTQPENDFPIMNFLFNLHPFLNGLGTIKIGHILLLDTVHCFGVGIIIVNHSSDPIDTNGHVGCLDLQNVLFGLGEIMPELFQGVLHDQHIPNFKPNIDFA